VINGRAYVAGGVDLNDEDILLTSLESISYTTCASATSTVIATSTHIAASTATSSRTGTAVGSTTPASTSVGTAAATYTTTSTAVTTGTATVCAITFSDVPDGSTFYPYVHCLACNGILSGYDDGTFRPGNDVTRGQLAKIVANAANFTEPVSGQTFEDVLPTDTFYPFVERMAVRGIIGGYPCGGPGEPCGPDNRPYFRPNANALRAQISKIVSNAAGYDDIPVGQMFEDVPEGSPYYTWVQRLASRGYMGGYPCGSPGEPCGVDNRPYFRPYNNATRGQTAKIVSNTFFPNCAGSR
jgi:hypothetical protein